MTFWRTSSTEQKLAQIDGAIDLGLTAGQCALNCRTTVYNIRSFANYHGRRFGFGEQARRKAADLARALNGQNVVRLVRNRYEAAGFDPSNSTAAGIFRRAAGLHLFDPLPTDEEYI